MKIAKRLVGLGELSEALLNQSLGGGILIGAALSSPKQDVSPFWREEGPVIRARRKGAAAREEKKKMLMRASIECVRIIKRAGFLSGGRENFSKGAPSAHFHRDWRERRGERPPRRRCVCGR